MTLPDPQQPVDLPGHYHQRTLGIGPSMVIGEDGDDLVLGVTLSSAEYFNFEMDGMRVHMPMIIDLRGPHDVIAAAHADPTVLADILRRARTPGGTKRGSQHLPAAPNRIAGPLTKSPTPRWSVKRAIVHYRQTRSGIPGMPMLTMKLQKIGRVRAIKIERTAIETRYLLFLNAKEVGTYRVTRTGSLLGALFFGNPGQVVRVCFANFDGEGYRNYSTSGTLFEDCTRILTELGSGG